MTPSLKNSDAYNAEILANAIRFDASLFLGSGKYANASEKTLEDIKIAAEMLKEENASAKGEVMIYAIDEGGNKALISGKPYKAKGKLSLAPIGEATQETISSAGREDEVIEAGPLFGKGISAIIAAAQSAEKTVSDELAAAIDGIPARLEAGDIFVKAPENMHEIMLLEPADIAGGIAAEHAAAKPAKAPKAPKAAKAEKPAKAPKEPKAAAAPKVSARAAAAAEAAASAAAGIIPAAPDFSKDTHKSWRKRLAAIIAMIEAGDIAGLKADTTEPKSSSRAILCRFRDLAIIALEAKAAKG